MSLKLFLFTLLIMIVSCVSKPTSNSSPVVESIPFESIGTHIVLLPVKVNGSNSTFIFDTGIGPNMISESLCRKLGCHYTGTFEDRRMSGQALKMPTAVLDALQVGSVILRDVEVCVWDMKDFPKEFSRIEGFISPVFFLGKPFTMDFNSKTIRLESEGSMLSVKESGASVPMEVKFRGPSVQLFAKIKLPTGSLANVEVDTGSNSLILDEQYKNSVMKNHGSKELKKSEGTDETGYHYVRYFGQIGGPIEIPGYPRLKQDDPNVMFQKIIYDGLLGTAFLRLFAVTYDLKDSVMIFNNVQH